MYVPLLICSLNQSSELNTTDPPQAGPCIALSLQAVLMTLMVLLLLEGVAIMLLIKSGVLPWTHCCRHKKSGVFTMALYFAQVKFARHPS